MDYRVKHDRSKEGERNIALGRADCIIDCSAREAMAWVFDYCSRDRVRVSRENGHPARFILRETSQYDNIIATVTAMPFPFRKREFVSRNICAIDDQERYIVAAEAVSDVVDFGSKIKSVRGTVKNWNTLEGINPTQCKYTLFLYVDAGGNIPVWLANSKIAFALSLADEFRAVFQRDDEIDAVKRSELAEAMVKEPLTSYEFEEENMLERVETQLARVREYDVLESTDHHVKMHICHGGDVVPEPVRKSASTKRRSSILQGHAAITWHGSTLVDTSIERCAAEDLSIVNRAHLKAEYVSIRNTDMTEERRLLKVNNHCSVLRHVFTTSTVAGSLAVDEVLKIVWKREEGGAKLVVAYESTEHTEFQVMPKFERIYSLALCKYEKLDPVEGARQTKVTYTQAVEIGGRMLKTEANEFAGNRLMQLSTTRKLFDKSVVIDRLRRERFAQTLTSSMVKFKERYSDYEKEILKRGGAYFLLFEREFERERKKSIVLTMATPQVSAKMTHTSGDNFAWGWTSGMIRAEAEEVLAFMWDFRRRTGILADDLEKNADEEPNNHNLLLYIKKRIPKPFDHRDTLSRIIWKSNGIGSYDCVSQPEESEKRPPVVGVIRATYESAMKIIRVGGKGETKLEYVIHPNYGGSVPSWIVRLYIKSHLSFVSEIGDYFQGLRLLENYDEKDGVAIGEAFMLKTKAEKDKKKGLSKYQVSTMVE